MTSRWLTTHKQVAVIASNFELAEMIQNYKPDDIGECVEAILNYTARNRLTFYSLIVFNLLWILPVNWKVF